MAKIKVLYFARLRETLATSGEELELPVDVVTVADIMALLAKRDDSWQQVFSGSQPLRAAVNQTLVKNSAEINAGDEVAFFPPVTGG
jgi:molybdopterin synthase sulfur carrier subunit